MNWLPYIPTDLDVQVSRTTDFEACVSYSAVHIAEMLLRKQLGYFTEFSERALAKLSDTQPWGNSLQNVVNALNQHGLLLSQDWPELTYSSDYENIDWATYYATIPVEILRRAYKVEANFFKINPTQQSAYLEKAPLWTIIKTSSGILHIVAQINPWQYYDSYEIRLKNFQNAEPIQSQYYLQLNINPMIEFVHKLGSTEYGLLSTTSIGCQYVPASTEADLKARGASIVPQNADGSIDYTKARSIQL